MLQTSNTTGHAATNVRCRVDLCIRSNPMESNGIIFLNISKYACFVVFRSSMVVHFSKIKLWITIGLWFWYSGERFCPLTFFLFTQIFVENLFLYNYTSRLLYFRLLNSVWLKQICCPYSIYVVLNLFSYDTKLIYLPIIWYVPVINIWQQREITLLLIPLLINMDANMDNDFCTVRIMKINHINP